MNMIDVAAEVQAVTDALAAAGISASPDARDLNPPCVWVNVDAVDPNRLDGSGTLTLLLYLIVPDQDTIRAWESLQRLLAQVVQVIPPTGELRPEAVVLPADSTPLPALALPRSLTVAAVPMEGI